MVEHERHEYTAALGVFSENGKSFDRGDQSSRVRADLKRRRAGWILEADDGDGSRPLVEQVTELVNFLEANQEAFDGLGDRVFRDLWLVLVSGEAQGGFTFSPELLRRLANLEIEVVFDLY
jgi:hypothetical protein